LFDKDEVTWQSILYDLVRTEKMDPWDIDVSLLAQRFLDMLKSLKQMDFRISGKIILAAAILLKMKSNRLLGEDLDNFDRLFSGQEEDVGLLDDSGQEVYQESLDGVKLIPRTPQARKRKVSIYDLVSALRKAMEVKKRRVMRDLPALDVKIPEKKIDITVMIKGIYGRIKDFFSKDKESKLTFSRLIPSESKEDKVYTFIPLLHLDNQRKIDLKQEVSFGEIEILLMESKKEVDKELGVAS
jgi:segregation and condensation protein A